MDGLACRDYRSTEIARLCVEGQSEDRVVLLFVSEEWEAEIDVVYQSTPNVIQWKARVLREGDQTLNRVILRD